MYPDGLTADDAKAVTTLDVSNKSISDLTGIEYFTGLNNLECSDNQLTSLNVRNNLKLLELSCRFNSLSTLDVSNNLELRRLDVQHNSISSLDVTMLSNLQYLACVDNPIISLDISKNQGLGALFVSATLLESLDLSSNTNIDELQCRSCHLSSLDITRLEKLALLDCVDTNIAELDLSKNTAIQYLLCSDNRLTSLDLSQNLDIIYLYCGDNHLTTLDLSQNTALSLIEIGGQTAGSITAIKTGGIYYLDLTPFVGAANLGRVCDAQNAPLAVDANGRIELGTTLPESFIYYYDTQADIANRYMAVTVSINGATDVDPAPPQPVAALSGIYPSSFERYTGNEGDSCVFNLDRNGLSWNGQTARYGNTGVNGEVYENGFEVWIARWNGTAEISWVRATYALDGKYTALTGRTGLIKSYNTTNFDTTVYFYNGEQLLASYRLTPTNYTFTIQIDLTGVQELTLFVQDNVAAKGGTSFALADLMLY